MSILRIYARRVSCEYSSLAPDLCIYGPSAPRARRCPSKSLPQWLLDFLVVDYILASYNREDQRIKPLREGMERDIADICIRLLSYNPAGLERVLDFGRAQCKCSSLQVSQGHNK